MIITVLQILSPVGDQRGHQGLYCIPKGEPLMPLPPLLPQRDPEKEISQERSFRQTLESLAK